MKTRILSTVFVAMVLLCGCSSAKFTEYHVAGVIQGKGGGVDRSVNGIDFWEMGDSDREYQILGVISQNRRRKLPLGRLTRLFSSIGNSGDKDSAVAKAARKHGGDAVIFVSKDRGKSDAAENGDGNYKGFTLVVVKYVK